MPDGDSAKKLILNTSLQGYFFEGLVELNKKSLCPVPESLIFYSSEVLDKFSLSRRFFEVSEGKVREKVLGLKLLEATQLTRDEQRRTYQEVGEMSLMVCGYFAESVSKKIVDAHYYSQLGKMAYGQLNNSVPMFMDIPSFYGMVATSFESLVTLMSILASKGRGQDNQFFFKRVLEEDDLSEEELRAGGVLRASTDKVS